MTYSRPRDLLVDTNYISAWREGSVDPPDASVVYTSTTTLQELYNMQTGNGWEYRYQVPLGLAFGAVDDIADIRRFVRAHRGRFGTSRITRGNLPYAFTVRLPVDLAFHDEEYVTEFCHPHLVRLQKSGGTDSIRVLATEALGRSRAKPVVDSFIFVAEQNIEPIAADEKTGETAVILLRLMKRMGINYKKNPRNTFNDLLILATAIDYGLDLRTNDKVLMRLAESHGRSVTAPSGDFATLAAPSEAPKKSTNEIGGYVNSQWRKLPPRIY
ncbi:hypothetical protein [Rhodococcus triatomae]